MRHVGAERSLSPALSCSAPTWTRCVVRHAKLKSSNEQVCATTRDPGPMGILRQPSVANLGEAKHPFDHPYA